jgi:acyl-CoA reductase-like NAD-dependent aldehyde dehydrogenase
MNSKLVTVSCIALATLAGGCKRATETKPVVSAETPAQQMDKVQTAAKEAGKQMDKVQTAAAAAAQQVQDSAFAQRAEFVTKMQAQLVELNQSLDALAARIETSADSVKAVATPKLAALRDQAKLLQKQLDEAANATPSTWSGIKADSEKVYAALKEGLTQSRQWMSDKIAP